MFFILKKKLRFSTEKKLPLITPIMIIFTSRKLKTCLPSLNMLLDCNLKPHVVYETKFSGCNSPMLEKRADI